MKQYEGWSSVKCPICGCQDISEKRDDYAIIKYSDVKNPIKAKVRTCNQCGFVILQEK